MALKHHYFAFRHIIYFVIGILVGIGSDQFLGIKVDAIAQYASAGGFSRNQTLTLNDQSNFIINIALEKLLDDVPNSKRTTLDIIHGSSRVLDPTVIPLLKYDITNTRAVPGHSKSVLRSDLPLNQWSNYIPELLNNKCRNIEIGLATDASIDAQIGNNTSYVVCPINNQKKELIGGLFLYFDNPHLDGQDLEIIIKKMTQARLDIAQALVIRLDKEYRY